MQYFDQGFINFFKSLSKHNSKEWFDKNRDKYEDLVKRPFEEFITDLIGEIRKSDKTIDMLAKQAIFRIYKDVRFSKDKSPYKTSVSAAISAQGKNPEFPGIFIDLNHEKVGIICGAYVLEKDNLTKVRKHIIKNLTEFQKVISEKDFRNHFGVVLGEKNKVLSPDIKAWVEKEPLLANKQFYYAADLPLTSITNGSLLETVVKHYKIAKPVNDFFIKALTKK
jgi:uncharacterized protein (TIGR02453 family)